MYVEVIIAMGYNAFLPNRKTNKLLFCFVSVGYAQEDVTSHAASWMLKRILNVSVLVLLWRRIVLVRTRSLRRISANASVVTRQRNRNVSAWVKLGMMQTVTVFVTKSALMDTSCQINLVLAPQSQIV